MTGARFVPRHMPDESMLGDWRRRADELDERAHELRLDGDPIRAEELELEACEWRAVADQLEAALDRVARLEP